MKKLIENRYLFSTSTEYKSKPVLLFCTILLAFTTCTEEPETLPKVNTIAAEAADITSTSAVLKGEILILGNMNITEYGIEISKGMTFSASETRGYATPAVQGIYQVEFTNLDPDTIYYYRAYAIVNTAQVHPKEVPYLHFTTNPAR